MPPPFESPDLQKLSLRESLRSVRSFASYYLPYKGLALLDLGAILVQAGAGILTPLAVYGVLHKGLPSGDLAVILKGALLVLLPAVLQSGAEYVCLRWGHILGTRMESAMREELFSHLQRMPFSFFDRNKTGQLMSRLTNDLTMLAETAHHGPEDILVSLLTMAGAFFVMARLNVTLTVAAILPMPVILIWGYVFQGRMRNGFRMIRKKIADMNSGIENSIQGIREVQSFSNETQEIRRFTRVNGEFRNAKEQNYRIMASFHAGLGFMLQLYTLVFILAGAVLMCLGRSTFAETVTFYMYSRYIVMPLMRLLHFTDQFQMAMASFERFRELMREENPLKDPVKPVEPEKLEGEIVFDKVSFRYPSRPEEEVLKELSFRIPKGSTAALVGESGAGKSTIASLIPRFYDVSGGTLLIDGVSVTSYRQDFLHRNIGFVRQSPFLFDASIRENILFGRPDATEEEVRKAAEQADVMEFASRLPEGLDTQIGEHGIRLSGGQKQRISIARVFLKNPPILIFDEATSSLDNESEEVIRQAMASLCRERTSLIIAHRLSTIRNADRIFCIRKGRIEEQGTHDELMKNQSYYAELYALSFSHTLQESDNHAG